jgi:hypothetical protein
VLRLTQHGAEGVTGMADIKQAANWMQEGKSVRRSGWPEGHLAIYTEFSTTQMMMVVTKPTLFTQRTPACERLAIRLESLLADDWEIAE